jgi:tetratricopeptide (TPR) repeat protein
MRCFLLSAVLFIICGAAYAADDSLTQGMKLYEKRHYEEAANLLRQSLATAGADRVGGINLALGMTYLKSAILHRELQQTSVVIYSDYLKRLGTSQGKGGSRFVDLYIAELLLDNGKPGEAAPLLERFLVGENLPAKFLDIAKAELGLCYHLQGDQDKAKQLWEAIVATDPEVQGALAAVYGRAGMAEREPLAMCDKAIAAAKKGGKKIPMRLLKDALTVYASLTQTDKGLDLIRNADLRTFSYEEKLGKNKIIYFYDLALLEVLTKLYGQAALTYLARSAVDPKLRETADYYLGEAHYRFGNLEQASRFSAASVAAGKLPPSYRSRATVREAAILFRQGHRVEAVKEWEGLAQKLPADPELLAETVAACAELKAEAPKVLQRATAAAESGEGKKFFSVNAALGSYHLARKNYAKAVAFMEAGRDKGNKNKIEANDPLLLVELAEAYYRTKKFSEAQEIYFEMGKQFPQVRQIQDALQGIYSREQKSAGDVRIF